MARTLTEIRNGLANTINGKTSVYLNTYAFVPDTGNLPALVIEPVSVMYEGAMGRHSDVWDFNVFVLISRNDMRSAQELLDALVAGSGPDSIRQIIEEHDDLGLGEDDSVTASVYAMHGYGGAFEWAGTPHIGAIIKVRVLVD